MTTKEISLSHDVCGADEAYREFRAKGYVVFTRAIGLDLVERMYAVWEEYFTPYRKQKPHLNRFLMHLPFKEPLYDPLFIENPLVMQIVDRVLGRNAICSYFGSETPLPGAEYMQAHFDLAFWNRMKFLNPPLSFLNKLLGSMNYYYGLQLSVALVDSNADNAPFEIWPATNRFSLRRSGRQALLVPAGSIILRDIRNLHRGTPHRGTAARPFLSLVYLRPWVHGWKAPEIPSDVYRSLPERSQRLFRHASIGQDLPDPESWARRSR